ncbi:MAG: J domain-containing protein [Halobaculum sp.]
MDRDTLVVGLAAVFAGCTVTMTVLALTQSLFLLLIAVPFALATYLLWYQASGRMRERMRARAARDARRGARHDREASEGAGGGRSRFAEEARERRRARADGATGDPTRRAPTGDRMARREAYDTLGVEPDASEAAIRDAYRERVKEVHPDSGGDEETFKRVTEAYETLTE